MGLRRWRGCVNRGASGDGGVAWMEGQAVGVDGAVACMEG